MQAECHANATKWCRRDVALPSLLVVLRADARAKSTGHNLRTRSDLLNVSKRVSLTAVRNAIVALLAIMLAFQVSSFVCAAAQANAAIAAPCCDSRCPAPHSAADLTCCQQSDSGSTVEQVSSSKSYFFSAQLVIGLIQPHSAAAVSRGFGRTAALQASPTASLALLCSRQI